MKACAVCDEGFTPYRSSQIACRKDDCRKEMARRRQRRFYSNNPEYQREQTRRWRERNPGAVRSWPVKREVGEQVRRLKEETPCGDCGGSFPPECMDFDHVRGEKVNNIGTMVAHGWSGERIFEEIAKCDIVCANCHRIRTRRRRSNG